MKVNTLGLVWLAHGKGKPPFAVFSKQTVINPNGTLGLQRHLKALKKRKQVYFKNGLTKSWKREWSTMGKLIGREPVDHFLVFRPFAR